MKLKKIIAWTITGLFSAGWLTLMMSGAMYEEKAPMGYEEHFVSNTYIIGVKSQLKEDHGEGDIEHIEFDAELEGDGIYTEGNEVHLYARPVLGYDFLGWYRDYELVCKEIDYVFPASEDADFVALYSCKFIGEDNAHSVSMMYTNSYNGLRVRAYQDLATSDNILYVLSPNEAVLVYNYDEDVDWSLVMAWTNDGVIFGWVYTEFLGFSELEPVEEVAPETTESNDAIFLGSGAVNTDWKAYLYNKLVEENVPNVEYWYTVALAIAWQESTWNPNVTANRGYQIDTGLFQIAVHSEAESEVLKNPINNINAFLYEHSFIANIKAGLPVYEVVARHKYNIYCRNSCTNGKVNVNRHGCSIYDSYTNPDSKEDSKKYVENIQNKWKSNYGQFPF